MADKKFNIKDQLAGIAALIAAIVAIGGGFVKYGEITTKLDAIEAREQVVIDRMKEEAKALGGSFFTAAEMEAKIKKMKK